MNTCKNCKWWGLSWEGVCERPNCRPEPPEEKRFDVVATADDASNLNAELHTGPDFGCVLFEQKGAEE